MIRWTAKIGSYSMIVVGTFLMASGINLIYEPMSMVTGGFSGIGILLERYLPVPLWVTTAALNVPLFLIAWKKFGMKFLGKSLFAACVFSLALAVVPSYEIRHIDYLMAALMGGALNGLGLGLVFYNGASTGGSDLLCSLLRIWVPWMSDGAMLMVIDGIIVAFGMFVFGIQNGLYAIVAVLVTSKMMDRILEGMKFAKMLYIISDQDKVIAKLIMEKMERGVTSLEGTGMYSGSGKSVLMCAVSRKEAVSVVNLVKSVDERAFVIVTDAREVMGEGFMQNSQKI